MKLSSILGTLTLVLGLASTGNEQEAKLKSALMGRMEEADWPFKTEWVWCQKSSYKKPVLSLKCDGLFLPKPRTTWGNTVFDHWDTRALERHGDPVPEMIRRCKCQVPLGGGLRSATGIEKEATEEVWPFKTEWDTCRSRE